jgi:hypothetical protein
MAVTADKKQSLCQLGERNRKEPISQDYSSWLVQTTGEKIGNTKTHAPKFLAMRTK